MSMSRLESVRKWADHYLWHRDDDVELRAALDRRMHQLVLRFVPAISFGMFVMVMVLRPTDRMVFGHDEELMDMVWRWRVFIGVCGFLPALGVRRVRALRRIPFAFGMSCFTAGVFVSGLLFARYGGLDSPYFFLSYSLVVLVVALPVKLPKRALATASLRIAFLSGFVITAPETLTHPMLGLGLVVGLVADLASILIGHIIYHLSRSNYGKEIRLEAQAAELRVAKAKSENLLLNILPEPIADRLKESDEAIADRFADVTVLFADICDFTPLSESMSPEALVSFLNEVFSAFDDLVDGHRLEKIKTIGDAYMVAAGIPEPRPDHAEAAAQLALDMRRVVLGLKTPGGLPLRLRIGIHSGPVVAGVIGRRKFIYDLWGDTVNTASRMESHGVENVIQVTDETHALLKLRYVLEPRGIVEVKGKGPMHTWCLLGRADEAPAQTPSPIRAFSA